MGDLGFPESVKLEAGQHELIAEVSSSLSQHFHNLGEKLPSANTITEINTILEQST